MSSENVSKWEVGDSTPNMEKLIAMSDLFDVSLDKLVMGKEEEEKPPSTTKSEFVTVINEKVLTNKNKKRAKSILKVVGIILITIPLIDVISMIIYFAVNDILL